MDGAAIHTKRPVQSLAFSGAKSAPDGRPYVEFTTLGPFGGGRCSLSAWPRVREQLTNGSRRAPGPCAFFAEIVGSLV